MYSMNGLYDVNMMREGSCKFPRIFKTHWKVFLLQTDTSEFCATGTRKRPVYSVFQTYKDELINTKSYWISITFVAWLFWHSIFAAYNEPSLRLFSGCHGNPVDSSVQFRSPWQPLLFLTDIASLTLHGPGETRHLAHPWFLIGCNSRAMGPCKINSRLKPVLCSLHSLLLLCLQ